MDGVLAGVARAGAFCLGFFALLNIGLETLSPGFDANLWWIDVRPLPPPARHLLLGSAGGLLTLAALRPWASEWLSTATRIAVLLLLAVVVWNAATFGLLLRRGEIASACPVPFSAILVPPLVLLATYPWIGRRASRGGLAAGTAVVLMMSAGLPLAHMLCFGLTDYRRPADAAVVFGAKVFPDGQPSLVLADRTRTACALYNAGLVRKLILSGGPGAGQAHETDAMRRIALDSGIPERDLIVDRDGLNTQATVDHAVETARSHGLRRLLAVSHFYHLPRIKLTFHRAGSEVYTVPARETRRPYALPWYMAREVAALWVYFLRV